MWMGGTAMDLQQKRSDILRLADAVRARNLRVFGSVARGDDCAHSDVDLLIDMDGDRSLLDVVRLGRDLEQLLDRRVPVLTDRSLHPALYHGIVAESQSCQGGALVISRQNLRIRTPRTCCIARFAQRRRSTSRRQVAPASRALPIRGCLHHNRARRDLRCLAGWSAVWDVKSDEASTLQQIHVVQNWPRMLVDRRDPR
jgi:uncharacterized protein